MKLIKIQICSWICSVPKIFKPTEINKTHVIAKSHSLSFVQINAHMLNLGQGIRQRKGLETDIEMLYFTHLPSGRTGRGSHLN